MLFVRASMPFSGHKGADVTTLGIFQSTLCMWYTVCPMQQDERLHVVALCRMSTLNSHAKGSLVSYRLRTRCRATVWRWSRMQRRPPESWSPPRRWHPLHKLERCGPYTPASAWTKNSTAHFQGSGQPWIRDRFVMRRAAYLPILSLPDDETIVWASGDEMTLWSCSRNKNTDKWSYSYCQDLLPW